MGVDRVSLSESSGARVEFVDVFVAQRDAAVRFAYVLTGDSGLAEDVVADAFAAMYGRWRHGRIDDPAAYLRRAIVNQARGRFRRAAVRRAHERRLVAPNSTNAAVDERVAERDRVRRALAQLPARRARNGRVAGHRRPLGSGNRRPAGCQSGDGQDAAVAGHRTTSDRPRRPGGAMNDVDPYVRDTLSAIADEAQSPPDLWDRVQHRIRLRRRRRASITVAAALTVIAAVVAGVALARQPEHRSGLAVQPTVPTSNTVPRAATTTETPTTNETSPTTGRPTSPTTTLNGAAALATFLASHPDAVVQSALIPYGNSEIAVVGIEPIAQNRTIVVVAFTNGAFTEIANLPLPSPNFDFARSRPIQVADVTGDGLPDALVRFSGADNDPGVLVSADGGSWRLVPESANPSDIYLGRNPTIVNRQLHGTRNDCIPNYAQGHTTTIVWRYDTPNRDLTSR